MLIKWMSKKVLEQLIKEATKQLPELKDKILAEIEAHKDEFLKAIIEHLKEALIDFLKKRFGK